jgi:transcriptional regulator with XRE-family HTH domain
MVDFRAEQSLGARIQAARKARGMRSTKDLADAIKGGNVTESIIENIESGRKVSLDISQLLNIAMALRMPLSYLLAPLGNPHGPLDLPNLSDDFAGMTAIEFDGWLSTADDGAYTPATLEERNAVSELQALRAWTAQNAEVHRLEIALELDYRRSTEERLEDARRVSEKLATFLKSAGWTVD